MSKDKGAKVLREVTGLSHQRCTQILRERWGEIEAIREQEGLLPRDAIRVFGEALVAKRVKLCADLNFLPYAEEEKKLMAQKLGAPVEEVQEEIERLSAHKTPEEKFRILYG